jgi:alcohol-forming fatty acyl-CoA reductase
MHCDKDINANIVPVDMTVNALLAAAWDVSEKYQQFSAAKKIANETEVPIYNFVSSIDNPLTWGDFTKFNIKYGFEFPFTSAIWYITFRMHRSATVNKIYTFFLHILPALLIDTLGLCVGQKPR